MTSFVKILSHTQKVAKLMLKKKQKRKKERKHIHVQEQKYHLVPQWRRRRP